MTALVSKASSLVRTAALAGSLLAPLAFAGQAGAQDAYPSERLDWTIAFGPGGGNDIMARTIVDILQKY